jgi:hypothetical protein
MYDGHEDRVSQVIASWSDKLPSVEPGQKRN